MNLNLKKQIEPLINLIKNTRNAEKVYELIEQLEIILKIYLARNKHDSEIWILLALTIYQAPIHNIPDAEQYLEYVLSYDENNYKAVLLLGYIKYYSAFTLNNEFYEQLCKIISPTPEIAALIEFVKYLYCDFFQDNQKAESHLLKSIEYDNTLVKNNIHLARFYLWEQNNYSLYKQYMIKGYQNIKYVYRDDIIDPYFDMFNIDEYFNEGLKGIHLSASNYESLREEYNKIMNI